MWKIKIIIFTFIFLAEVYSQYHYPPQPDGALGDSTTRKRVYISPGHGYYYNFSLGYWTTQRSEINGLTEDFHTNEIVMDYLARYLYNAGAQVFICRERARQTNEIIVDNDDGSPNYTETGTWTTSSYTGYDGGTYRYANASVDETATARWTPNISDAGYYPVYVWYRAGSNRVTDAKFKIKHSGGVTQVIVNQQDLGMRWVWLGEFYFEAGTDGYVELSNQSSQSAVVIADAVRFGAGYGSIARDGVTSGQPRWKEAARYWLEYLGAPDTVYDFYSGGTNDKSDDVCCRPEYADWNEDYAWENNAVYVSIHTNAYDGTASGTETYIHDTSPTPGSATLCNKIHTQVVNDIQALYDSAWIDRGEKSANFGELREIDTMPATLLEIAFHDNLSKDNPYLHDPVFRDIVARAIYKGIVKYFGQTAILPYPPSNVQVYDLGGGDIQLTWSETSDPVEGTNAQPAGYKIYKSTNEYGFDNGIDVGNTTSYVYSGFQPGTYYFYVSAYNAGGESLPSTPVVSITLVDDTPPTQPGKPAPSQNPNAGDFTLSWTASTDDYGQVTYVIYRSTDASGPWDESQAVVSDIETNSYTFTNHEEGKFYFRVKAKDGSGNVAWSDVSDAVVVDKSPPPSPNPLYPVNETANTSTPTLQWSSVNDTTGVKYDVQISTKADFSQIIQEAYNLTTNSYTVSPLANGTYYWRVRAKDGAGNQSSWADAQFKIGVVSGGKGGGGGGGCGMVGLELLLLLGLARLLKKK